MSRKEIAEDEGLTTPYVFKIAKDLIAAGFVTSRRGRTGGYVLVQPAEAITLADVYKAVEGTFALTPCDEDCERRAACATAGAWHDISEELENAMYKHTIAEMANVLRRQQP